MIDLYKVSEFCLNKQRLKRYKLLTELHCMHIITTFTLKFYTYLKKFKFKYANLKFWPLPDVYIHSCRSINNTIRLDATRPIWAIFFQAFQMGSYFVSIATAIGVAFPILLPLWSLHWQKRYLLFYWIKPCNSYYAL